jgi:hypothetical protein
MQMAQTEILNLKQFLPYIEFNFLMGSIPRWGSITLKTINGSMKFTSV